MYPSCEKYDAAELNAEVVTECGPPCGYTTAAPFLADSGGSTLWYWTTSPQMLLGLMRVGGARVVSAQLAPCQPSPPVSPLKW